MRKSPNDALLLVTFEFEANAIYEMIKYSDGTTERGRNLRRAIANKLQFASLDFQSLDGVVRAIGLDPCDLCTYCWNGKE